MFSFSKFLVEGIVPIKWKQETFETENGPTYKHHHKFNVGDDKVHIEIHQNGDMHDAAFTVNGSYDKGKIKSSSNGSKIYRKVTNALTHYATTKLHKGHALLMNPVDKDFSTEDRKSHAYEFLMKNIQRNHPGFKYSKTPGMHMLIRSK